MSQVTPAPLAGTDLAHQLASSIESVLSVERVITSARAPARIELYGQLLTDPERAYGEMAARFAELGCTPVLRRSGGGVVVIALPKVAARPSSRDAGALVSFGLTVISVLYAGGLLQATDWLWPFQHPLAGVPFAIGLLGVLVAHELGHYLVSRRLGVATSLPFFIPMPVLSLFGTMGAIIRTREPMRNRRQVLAIGAAGPLSGLIVAVPLLLLGLLRSEVQPILNTPGSLMEGNFALYALLKFLVFGRLLPSGGYDVFLAPVAFGAWAALFITGLNLTPAGQLDGGHVAYALLGHNARWLSRLMVAAAVALGFVWSGWWTFAVVLVLLGQHHAEPLDDLTPLRTREKLLAVAVLVLFLLLFTPVPITVF